VTKKTSISLVVAFAALFTAGSLFAHHSFVQFDGEKIVNLKGVVTRFAWVNPHSLIFVDAKGVDGKVEHWALEGPAINQLVRLGFSQSSIKPGETVEACGYVTKDGVQPIKGDADSGASGRIINVELLKLPDGENRLWQDYGKRKCRDAQPEGVTFRREFGVQRTN